MSDTELIRQILSQIIAAVERVLRRFEPVESVDWFLDTEEGFLG